MSDGYQKKDVTALPAGDFVDIPVQGTYVRILTSTHDVFSIGIGDISPTFCYRGFSFEVPYLDGRQKPFTSLRIRNDDPVVALTAVVLVATGKVRDDRVIIASSSLVPVSFDYDNRGTALDVAVPQNTLTLLAAALVGTARRLVIASLSANTAEVRIGGGDTTATRGAPLQPGESITVLAAKSFYAYQAAVAAQSIAIYYEVRS